MDVPVELCASVEGGVVRSEEAGGEVGGQVGADEGVKGCDEEELVEVQGQGCQAESVAEGAG